MDQTGEYTSNRARIPFLPIRLHHLLQLLFLLRLGLQIYLWVSTSRMFLGLKGNFKKVPRAIYIIVRASRGNCRVRCSTKPWSRGGWIPFLIPEVITFPSSRTRAPQRGAMAIRSLLPKTPTASLSTNYNRLMANECSGFMNAAGF